MSELAPYVVIRREYVPTWFSPMDYIARQYRRVSRRHARSDGRSFFAFCGGSVDGGGDARVRGGSEVEGASGGSQFEQPANPDAENRNKWGDGLESQFITINKGNVPVEQLVKRTYQAALSAFTVFVLIGSLISMWLLEFFLQSYDNRIWAIYGTFALSVFALNKFNSIVIDRIVVQNVETEIL